MLLQRNGVSLAYDDVGQGSPPLLFIHGWGMDRTAFKLVVPRFQSAHRVVSVDLRGFGESEAPEQDYTIAGYADDVAFMATELGLERPVVIGFSMGGAIALDVAARYGDRVSGAVILESPVVPPEGLWKPLELVIAGLRTDAWRGVATRLTHHLAGPHLDPDELARLLHMVTSRRQDVLASSFEGLRAFDSVAAAKQVKCPLLYVGTSLPYVDLPRLRELCPDLLIEQLVDCGHFFPLEAPDQLVPIIKQFL
jgi:pimeloyl-ACP methyl ester carboxylesterase